MNFKTLSFVIATLLISCCLQAQEAKPLPRHPGDVIKYEVKFDGPNADKMTLVLLSMNTGMAAPKDQVGFATSFGSGWVQSSSPKTFIVEITIPANAATGDYSLSDAQAQSADGGRANYNRQDFSVPPIHIENPKTFTPPSITVKPLP
jgi:hypothetical protein